MRFCITHLNLHNATCTAARSRSWIALLMLGMFVAAAQSAVAQQYVGTIDMPQYFDNYGGQGMSLNPNTGRLYIADLNMDRVVVADTETDKALYVLPVPHPRATAYDPVRNRVYVMSYDLGQPVYVLDAATDTFLHSLDAGYGSYIGIDFNPSTGRIYAVGGTKLAVIDADAESGEPPIAIVDLTGVISDAYQVVVNPDTNLVYVADFSRVAVLDGATNTVLTVLTHPGNSYAPTIAIDVALNRIFIPANDQILVIDGASNTIVQQIAHPGMGMGIAVDPVTHRVYVSNDVPESGTQSKSKSASNANYHAYNGNGVTLPEELVVIDGVTGTVIGVHQSPYCQGILVDPDTGLVYLADRGNPGDNNVFVFDDVAP